MRNALLMVVAAVAVAGCQSREGAWQSGVLPTSDVRTAFETARAVLAEDYIIARADEAIGRIETRPLLIPKTGSDRKLGAYLSSGDVQNYRRVVVCRIEPGEAGVVIRLAANVQREGTSQAEALLVTSEGGDARQAGAERRWRYLDEQRTTYWADVGRDRDVEADLLKRIRARLSGAAPPAAPANAAGTAQ